MTKKPPAEVLRLVNEARVALGKGKLKELPKGGREDCETCPLSIALGMIVHSRTVCVSTRRESESLVRAWGTGGRLWSSSGTNWDINLPEPLVKFVEDFDAGKYPDLIDDWV